MKRSQRLVSFDVFRTLGIDGVEAVKPEAMFAAHDALRRADWVLFPEEWQINLLVHVLGCRIFPSIASYRFGQDKVQFTRAMWLAAPEHMPATLILPATAESAARVVEELGFPMVVKEPRSSMGQGVFRIDSRAALFDLLPGLSVLYAQEYLAIGRDLRVVWIGDAVVGAYWRSGEGFYHNIARGADYDFSAVPESALALVTRIATALGINHAGFDLACVDGHWYVIEANVRFGNEGLRAMGIDTAALISDWLEREDDRDRPMTA